MRRRSITVALGGVALLPLLALAGGYWTISHPRRVDLPLPEGSVALDVPEGRALLASAATADLDGLLASFQSQEKSSWCGVASSVVVLDARGDHLTQDAFFTPEATAVRSWWRVTLTGMPLDDLAGMLRAHGADVEVHHADDVDEAAFRAALRTNLATPGDWLVANYDRSALGESGGGHLSPLGGKPSAKR
ncbi:MAG: hypothetical protein H6735_27485, partial [Alphaproteobacteria bacterium]|nr:hypothetical protein [Alphaproteobacteria bacterium]